MTETWLEASKLHGSFAPVRDHLLQDKKVEKKLGFDMTSSWEAAQAGLLLAGQQVFFTPGGPACSINRTMLGFGMTWASRPAAGGAAGPLNIRWACHRLQDAWL